MEKSAALEQQRDLHSRMAVLALIILGVLYCSSAWMAPFWGDNDTWSNVLPVIQYRHSILEQHVPPLHTDLWYGGRDQWANPLWNFFYLPSTVIWLIFPLDWATRIVFLGHFIFALLAARMLAGLFLKSEFDKVSFAILLTAPLLPALIAGHVEKVLSWGWVLLSVFFLLNENLSLEKRGMWAGLCLGVIPLTGSNYYTFYAMILLVPLAMSYRNLRLLTRFFVASLIGLVHAITIWPMVGHSRAHAKFYIATQSMSVWETLTSLTIGISKHLSWEIWATIGLCTVFLFCLLLVRKLSSSFRGGSAAFTLQDWALLSSGILFLLLTTGLAYRNHSWLDMFRVPSRAVAFLALVIVIFTLKNASDLLVYLKPQMIRLLWLVSVVQVAATAWFIRPMGSAHGPYEPDVKRLADTLVQDGAQSVWISTHDLQDMFMHVGLMERNLALPNVYYGDMGQSIPFTGQYCGYSFDHLITFGNDQKTSIDLHGDAEWSDTQGTIPQENLLLIQKTQISDQAINIYRVICP